VRNEDTTDEQLSPDASLRSDTSSSELLTLRQRIAELEALEVKHRQTVEALRESQEHFRDIFESAMVGLYRTTPDGRILMANPALVHMLGFSSFEELAQRNLEEEGYEPEYPRSTFEQLIETEGQIIGLESAWVRRDGTVLHVRESARAIRDDSGKTLYYEGTVEDITEQKKAAKALAQRNRELALLHRAGQTFSSTLDLNEVLASVLDEVRHLLNVVACSIWLVDLETDELVCQQATGPHSDIVRGWRLASGQGIAGWVAHSGESLIVPDILADERHFKGVDEQTGLKLRSILGVPLRVKEEILGVLQVVDEQVGRFDTVDLTLLEPLATSAAIAIENARLYEQVQQQAAQLECRVAERTHELAKALEQLRQLDRLKSKFVTDVSHELRTPVANIRLYAHLLQSSPPDKHDQFLTILANQTERLSSLIDDILSLSRLELGETEMACTALDLNKAAERVVTTYRSRAEVAGLELIFQPDKALPPVHADAKQLDQVITNLVDNAINYTLAGQVRATICLDAEREQACLEIQDTGMGIEPEDMPHLFERFYRGRRVGSSNIPGTGLGLAIVKEIVDLHGGTIDVESEVDRGSTFRVWLPLAADTPVGQQNRRKT
jgi:PAS domain S-box-containing protein